MVKVAPAILTDDPVEFAALLNQYIAAEFIDFIDIDLQDGDFVNSKTISVEDALEVMQELDFANTHITWDLMLKDPNPTIQKITQVFPDHHLLVHQSADIEFLDTYTKEELFEKHIGIAVNGKEKLSKKYGFYEKFPFIQLMTIQSGIQGQEFIPLALEKSIELRQMGFEEEIAIDGGVNLRTAEIIRLYGQEDLVNKVSVGSYLQKSKDLELDYRKLLLALNLHSTVD